jgi:gas vesicle protein
MNNKKDNKQVPADSRCCPKVWCTCPITGVNMTSGRLFGALAALGALGAGYYVFAREPPPTPMDKAKAGAEQIAEAAKDAAKDAQKMGEGGLEKAKDAVRDAEKKVEGGLDKAKDAVHDAEKKVEEKVEEAKLAAEEAIKKATKE